MVAITRDIVCPPGREIKIGLPISNVEVYVLDQRLEPVPVGVAGELYIGGSGVARGYLGQPEETAERFVPHPYSDRGGARLYRTGDVVKYRDDGELEYIGRRDEQVKVRGYRIELGEIETVLETHARVRQAVVTVRDQQQLVGYVVTDEGQIPVSELRQHLRRSLPDYMVPCAFVFLDKLPLTATGKVDRRALPAPDDQRSGTSSKYEAPRTPIEDVLAVLWSDVLGVERVGIRDNFFELGGHSLLAAKLLGRVKKSFGVELPMRVIFESQEIAVLAEAVENARRNKHADAEPPIERLTSREGTLPISFTQEHVWELAKLARKVTGPRRPRNMTAIFRLKGPLKLDVLERTFAEIVRRHEILRTTYLEVEENLVPSIAPSLPGVLRVVDLQTLPGREGAQEARRVATDCARQPFDLAGEVLFSATVLRLGAQEHVLVFLIDHFIFDDWSKDVFLNELAIIYDAYNRDQPSPLPELEFQFIDWAGWQRSKFRGEAKQKFIEFWGQRLDKNHPFPKLELPQVLPPPAVLTRRAQFHRKVLPRTSLEKLQTLARNTRVTTFMVHLAVLNTVLHAYTGKEKIGVITNVANRERPETQRIFGWITNQLVLPTDVSGNPSFSQLLERVRSTCMSAFEHADLPLPYLMSLFNDSDDSVAPPFVFLGVEPDRRAARESLAEKLQLADLSIEPVALESSGLTPGTAIWFNVEEIADGLKISIESGVDQYRPETMAEVLELYCRVIDSVVADPEQTISQLTMLHN